jgi:hypothetical protein
LSVIACLSFVLALADVRHGQAPGQNAAEAAQISEQDRTGSLLATVLRDGGGALSGATVQVFWEHAGRFFWIAAESTSSAGAAPFRRLPEGRVWLLADALGFARASTQLVLTAKPGSVVLTLHPAQTLEVTVKDETGAAIAGATVLTETSDPLPFGALSDEHGSARFMRLPAGPWSVKASRAGYESVARSGVRGALSIALRRLASIEIAVQAADGMPVSGASVMIAGPSLWPARSTLTGAGGLAHITGLLAGSYDLRASLGSDVAPTLLGFELARGANEKLTLRLEPGRNVVALVTDGQGKSPLVVANADVVLAEAGLSSFPLRGRTASDGKVSLGPIARGPATLAARAPDFVGSALVAVPEELNGPVQVVLTRGATIRGEVADARGYPIEGASIEVVGSDPSGLPIAETPALVGFRRNHFAWALPGPVPLIAAGELGVMPGPVPPIPKPGAVAVPTTNSADFEPLSDPEPWTSNRGGQFTARPVTPGRLRVIVRHPDYVEAESELVTLTSGGEATLKIVLLRGAVLEGRVLDERDQPAAGVELELSSPRAGPSQRATSASDGTFAFAAVPADVTLSLARPEDPARVVLRKSLHLADAARESLELKLPAVRQAVRVVVRDEADRPLELVEVLATSLEPTRPLRLTRFSDAEGVLTFQDAVGENLRIVAEAPGFARTVETVAAAPKDLQLTLKRGVIVEGRVTAVRGRQNVASARVTLQQSGVRKVATTDGDGVFRLRDVAPGAIRIRVEHPDFADEEAELQVTGTGRADRAFALPDIDLSEAGAVEGDLFDEHGARTVGARVASGEHPTLLSGGSPRGVALSDQEGHFLLSHVHPGMTLISAISSVAGRGSTRAEVSSGRTTRGLRIQLLPQATDGESLAEGSVAIGLGERGSAAALQVVVVSVAEASEAERAGVEVGDVLSLLDGVRPSSMQEARARLNGQPGSDIVIELLRDGVTQRLRVLREAARR